MPRNASVVIYTPTEGGSAARVALSLSLGVKAFTEFLAFRTLSRYLSTLSRDQGGNVFRRAMLTMVKKGFVQRSELVSHARESRNGICVSVSERRELTQLRIQCDWKTVVIGLITRVCLDFVYKNENKNRKACSGRIWYGLLLHVAERSDHYLAYVHFQREEAKIPSANASSARRFCKEEVSREHRVTRHALDPRRSCVLRASSSSFSSCEKRTRIFAKLSWKNIRRIPKRR